VEVDWGDGSHTRHRNSSHVYKKGRYTLRVTAEDRAGNTTVKSKALRIP
jgi:PKD repeat protein